MTRTALCLVAMLVAIVCVIPLVPTLAHASSAPALLDPRLMVLPLLVGSVSDTVEQDKDSIPALDTVRAMLNKLVADFNYFLLNGVASTTTAATPGCDIATTTTKVKTTNNTVLRNAGALNAFNAADNFWTLTGGVLAVSKFRRYLLCADAADAASVIASDDCDTAAACRFPRLPANGVAIVGILTVATDSTHTFTPGTTALSAAGITDTYIDGIDIAVPLAALVSP